MLERLARNFKGDEFDYYTQIDENTYHVEYDIQDTVYFVMIHVVNKERYSLNAKMLDLFGADDLLEIWLKYIDEKNATFEHIKLLYNEKERSIYATAEYITSIDIYDALREFRSEACMVHHEISKYKFDLSITERAQSSFDDDLNNAEKRSELFVQADDKNECGWNVTWRIEEQTDGTKTLIIEGQGEMYDFDEGNPAPWSGMDFSEVIVSEKIKSIGSHAFDGSSIRHFHSSEGLKTIGTAAFANCRELISVVLPKTIWFLGRRTFVNCSNLKYIRFPDSLILIPVSCCRNCTSLTLADIPNGVETIKEGAFINCPSLVDVELPHSAKDIRNNAFDECIELQYGECDFDSNEFDSEELTKILETILSDND